MMLTGIEVNVDDGKYVFFRHQTKNFRADFDKTLDAGPHIVEWNTGTLAAGNYYYQLRVGGISRVGLIVKIELC